MVPQTRSDWKPLLKALALAAVVAACLVVVYATPLKSYFRMDQMPRWREAIRAAGAWGPALFVIAGAVAVGVGFPRVVYNFAGGAAFGFLMGAVWSQIGTVLGTMGCFLVARTLAREWVEGRWGRRFARLERRMKENGFVIVLLVRLCPVGNNFITNCLAGVSSVGAGAFFLASLIGLAPQTIFLALLGSGVVKGRHGQTALGLGLLVAASVVFFFVYRYSRLASSVAKDWSEGSGAASPADGAAERTAPLAHEE